MIGYPKVRDFESVLNRVKKGALMSKTARELVSDLLNINFADFGEDFRISTLVGTNPVVLYGAGDGLITFFTFVMSRYPLKVESILDERYHAPGRFRGFPVMSPKDYVTKGGMSLDTIAIITVGKKQYLEQIQSNLRQIGFKKIIHASEIFEYHLSHALPGFETQSREFFKVRQEKIVKALDCLGDDKSRDVFMSVLKIYFGRRPQRFPCDPLEDQYFPRDINLSKGVSRFINCGSYDGDTLRQLWSRYGKVSAIACFEPDSDNFRKLVSYVSQNGGKLADFSVLFPCGVWRDETLIQFDAGNRINSSIGTGDQTIQCVAIDHVLPDFKPTFINMDVEGSELEALAGAETVIRLHRPDLAICAYHTPDQLWDILCWIRDLSLGYRCYMRNYTGFPAETVVYATIP